MLPSIVSRGSSGGIVSDNGLDGPGSIPDSGRGFFFQPLRPDRFWGPPSLLYNRYRGSGRDADHSPPSSAEIKYEQEVYLLSPHVPTWLVAGQLYFLLLPSIVNAVK
jgi:hypothetical protein